VRERKGSGERKGEREKGRDREKERGRKRRDKVKMSHVGGRLIMEPTE